MRHQNWVTPYGDIVTGTDRRGRWMGNRGCLHEGDTLVRRWATKRWITCALEYKGWVAPRWDPRRWTALFFDDEAVAFAAGHRPCALCRHADYQRYLAAIGMTGADAVDAVLHHDRVDGRSKRVHPLPWRELPDGAFVDLEGSPALVAGDSLRLWTARDGYTDAVSRPSAGDAAVLTPLLNVVAIQSGYELTR
jgi:hypothetical protein